MSTTTNIEDRKDILAASVNKLMAEYEDLGEMSTSLTLLSGKDPAEMLGGIILMLAKQTSVMAALSTVVLAQLDATDMLDKKVLHS